MDDLKRALEQLDAEQLEQVRAFMDLLLEGKDAEARAMLEDTRRGVAGAAGEA